MDARAVFLAESICLEACLSVIRVIKFPKTKKDLVVFARQCSLFCLIKS